MNLTVRQYKPSDYETLVKWWADQGHTPAWEALLPDTTYIVEIDNVPTASACLYLMNVPDAAMVENVIGAPEFKDKGRQEAVRFLFNFLEEEAKRRGYTTLVLFSYEAKVKELYQSFGYQKTLENVTTFAKDIR